MCEALLLTGSEQLHKAKGKGWVQLVTITAEPSDPRATWTATVVNVWDSMG